jgi:hypothetical protein
MPAEDVLLSVARLLLQTKQTFLERVDTGARQSTEIYFKKIRIDECDYRSVRFLSAALLVLCRAGDGTSWHMLVTLVGSYLAHLVFSNQSQENEMTKSFLAGLSVALIAMAVTARPASAVITCRNGTQWISAVGAWIEPPYCGDKPIAQVTGCSFTAIRTNPNAKAEACRFKGYGIRNGHLCDGYGDFGRRRY